MQLTHRVPTLADFDAFYDSCFSNDCTDTGLRGLLQFEWQTLLKHPGAMSMIVLDRDAGSDGAIVGCAQAVFVSDAFSEFVKTTETPCANAMVVGSLPDGKEPLLSEEQIRDANHQGKGLSVLITRWMRSNSVTKADEKLRVEEYMNRVFQTFARGYFFKEMLIPATGAEACQRGLATGFLLRNDYAEHYRRHPPAPLPHTHPYLLGITRKEALLNEGSLISHSFVYHPSRFKLTFEEQTLIRRAIGAETDKAIAAALHESDSNVKNRWRSIYKKAETEHPGLLTPMAGDTKNDQSDERGPEKRRLLLNYIRDHPEELRPTHLTQNRQKRERVNADKSAPARM